MTESGVRLDRQSLDLLGKGETLRPLRDHILVKVLSWRPSKIITIVGSSNKPLRGMVKAIGPGCYPWKYNAKRTKRYPSAQFRPTEVKIGDTVELGGLEIGGYSFPQILIENEMHVLIREEDVVGIHA